jgi:hypothetical protein
MSWRLEDEGNPSQQKRRTAELLAHQHLHVSRPSARRGSAQDDVGRQNPKHLPRARQLLSCDIPGVSPKDEAK